MTVNQLQFQLDCLPSTCSGLLSPGESSSSTLLGPMPLLQATMSKVLDGAATCPTISPSPGSSSWTSGRCQCSSSSLASQPSTPSTEGRNSSSVTSEHIDFSFPGSSLPPSTESTPLPSLLRGLHSASSTTSTEK